MTKITADFSAGIILPPRGRNYLEEYSLDIKNPLPEDGFVRITEEGAKILAEGLRGDFSRWAWGIGNHPIIFPSWSHARNLRITAMDDRPHFQAQFWYGSHFPQTKHYQVMAPSFTFDTLDFHEEYDPRTSVTLGQSSDYWAHLGILLDGMERCAT